MMGMQGIQGLSGMPGVQGNNNALQAAIAQGQYGMDAAKMNQQAWSDLIGGGSRLGAAMLGAGRAPEAWMSNNPLGGASYT